MVKGSYDPLILKVKILWSRTKLFISLKNLEKGKHGIGEKAPELSLKDLGLNLSQTLTGYVTLSSHFTPLGISLGEKKIP